MMLKLAQCACMLVACTAGVLAAEPGLLAHYTFDEAAGTVLKDRSGNGRDGTIHNADWVRSARGHALAFGASNSYVDCGVEMGRKLTADMSIAAWVRLAATSYPDSSTNWTLVDCEDYPRSGFLLRVDGQATKLYYRASCQGRTPGSSSGANIANGEYYHLAVTRRGSEVTLFVNGLPETSFQAERPATPSASLKISSSGQSFQGLIDDLAVYGRALSKLEVLARYKADAGAYGKDTSWFGTFQIEPFLYLDRGKATVAVNFLGVVPLPPKAEVVLELGEPGKRAVKSLPATGCAESSKQDFTFELAGLPAADYEIRAVLRDAAGKSFSQKGVRFRYPPDPVKVPSPTQKTLPHLPTPAGALPMSVHVDADGGFTVHAKGRSFPVSSKFSYPGGGFNVLGRPSSLNNRIESVWSPTAKQLGPSTHRIAASGKHYGLSRRIEVQPGRVVVQDTLTNKTAEPLGILVRHRVTPPAGAFRERYVAGYRSGDRLTAKPIKTNPTLFLSGHDMGLGMIALDDVFIVQSLATLEDGAATLHSDTFALDKHASYTTEWAIYATPTGDYYDFINGVRRDEGRNGTIDGGVGFITGGPGGRRAVPDRESVRLRSIKYGLVHCLSYSADDPGISIEGIEFVDFPKERRLLKEQFAATRRALPGMKIAFHVAHSLYATNKPDQIFADSRVIDANGRQAVYTANPGSYFSKERFAQNWNWYIYYPTLDNSFGRAMLESVDVMMDEIGADGPFMDGFMWAYGGEYTYDRWDGHSARIDPETKTIARKMGSVLLLSQDLLVAFCRKIRDKGGVVIANNSIMTRTIARENYLLHDRECHAGPEVHLAPTPTALSLPSAIRSEPDIHGDVLDKLAWGNLYVYYEEGRVSYPSVPAQMYPITFEEIHSGYVKGTQRLITMRSGLYGWRGDASLHVVYLYDRRGVQIRHDFVTTVDSAGARTQLDLGPGQCAVVKKIPLEVRSGATVNVRVDRYDEKTVTLSAVPAGPATLIVRSGDFAIKPQAEYAVATLSKQKRLAADPAGSLALSLEPGSQEDVRITSEDNR